MTTNPNLQIAAEAALELERRSEHALYTHVPGDTPEWNQKSFHESTAIYRLLFGGNQSGKSRSAAYEITCWMRGIHPYREIPAPPNKCWAISAEYITLQEGIYRHLIDMLPQWEVDYIGPKIPQQNLPMFIKLKNGSTVEFKSAKGDSRQKFQAAAVDLISIDEEVHEDIWTELQARTMATGGEFILSATLVESYEWICDLERRADEGEAGYFVARLDSRGNTYLHNERVAHLLDTWSEEEKEVRILGKSRRSTGLIYNTFSKGKHVVDPFPIPWGWPKWCALDPGIRTFAALWIAISPENKAYAYRELYEHGKCLYEIAEILRSLEGWKRNNELSDRFGHFVWEEPEGKPAEYMQCRLIDDKVGSRLITGDDGVLTQLYEKYGISTTPADKPLRPGIEDCRWWLDNGFHVFSNCHNFINEITKYRVATKKPKKDGNEPVDKPLVKDDHLMDCWRYIARDNPRYKDRDQLNIYAPTPVSAFDRIKRRKQEKEADYEHEFLGTEY
jgi:phage terminase large subunit-like protein